VCFTFAETKTKKHTPMKTQYLIFAFAILISGSNNLPGQTVTTDHTFGINGIVTSDLFNKNDIANDVIIQPDGKILVAASSVVQSHSKFAVVRYTGNGLIDTTFGDHGITSISVGSANDKATALALQADGKIVVCGYYDNNFYNDAAVIRLNTDGTIDTTFGASGICRFVLSNQFDELHDIAIQSDGKIVVGGRTFFNNSYDFLLIRLLADGTPDNSFGASGIVRTDINSSYDCIYSISLVANDKILVSGNREIGSSYFAAARYHSNGDLDMAFGTNGITTIGSGNRFDNCMAMAMQNDSSIILAGTHHNSNVDEYMIVKLDNNGIADSSFGANSLVLLPTLNANDAVNDVITQYDGRILLAGSGVGQQPVLLRLNEDGALDSTFGANGFFATNSGSSINSLNGIVMLPDSSVLMCGFSFNGLDNDILLTKALIDFTSSVEYNSGYLNLNIYPNPAADHLTVTLPYMLDDAGVIQIFGREGKLVLEHRFPFLSSPVNIGLPTLKQGVYFLQIKSKKYYSSSKFVVQ
jgi:uncharacterized delta-60 repeat protein